MNIDTIVTESFDYEPETGVFKWKKERPDYHFESPKMRNIWKGRCSGKKFRHKRGTVTLRVGEKKHVWCIARVVWFITKGYWPKVYIDHINGDHNDNRLSNLREAGTKENAWNAAIHRDNRSGFKGVFYARHAKKYASQICVHGKKKHLGYFSTPEAAYEVYLKNSRIAHGEFSVASR